MATRIVEFLILDDDPNTVENWLERLEEGIELSIFEQSDKLPTSPDEKAAKIDELKRRYLTSCLGPASYKLLKSYCQPAKLSDMSYTELRKLMLEKLSPKTNPVNEQYKFNIIKQETSENLTMFMARTKEAATKCEFNYQYDNMVRNRFITGLRDGKIRTSLISDAACGEKKLSADDMLEKALAKENANLSNTAMSGSGVNQVSRNKARTGRNPMPNPSNSKHTSNKTKQTVECAKCTMRGHTKAECRTRCRYCKKAGHIVKHCPVAGKKNNQRFVERMDDDPVECLHDPGSDYGYEDEFGATLHHVSKVGETKGMFCNVETLPSKTKMYCNKGNDICDVSSQNLQHNSVMSADKHSVSSHDKVIFANTTDDSIKVSNDTKHVVEPPVIHPAEVNSIVSKSSKPFLNV